MSTIADSLLDTLPDQQEIKKAVFLSGNYQADKVLVSSHAAPSNVVSQNGIEENTFYTFQISLSRPLLNVESVQLSRANIPLPQTSIPDTETTFWYYRIPSASIATPGIFNNGAYLHYVRLLPSWYKPEYFSAIVQPQIAINRTYTDYQDLAADLVKACAYDLQNGNATYGTSYNHIANDISITYDPVLNKFQMIGNNTGYFYIIAGYEIPLLQTAAKYLAAESVEYDCSPLLNIVGQAWTPYRTLGLRLGFNWDGMNTSLVFAGGTASNVSTTLINRFRPIPTYIGDGILTDLLVSSRTYTADSYANLVYTNCVNVYLDCIGNSSEDSLRDSNLLSAVPINCGSLGVGFYNPTIDTPMYKLQNNQLYDLVFTMLDDVGELYRVPNCGIVSFELTIKYKS